VRRDLRPQTIGEADGAKRHAQSAAKDLEIREPLRAGQDQRPFLAGGKAAHPIKGHFERSERHCFRGPCRACDRSRRIFGIVAQMNRRNVQPFGRERFTHERVGPPFLARTTCDAMREHRRRWYEKQDPMSKRKGRVKHDVPLMY